MKLWKVIAGRKRHRRPRRIGAFWRLRHNALDSRVGETSAVWLRPVLTSESLYSPAKSEIIIYTHRILRRNAIGSSSSLLTDSSQYI